MRKCKYPNCEKQARRNWTTCAKHYTSGDSIANDKRKRSARALALAAILMAPPAHATTFISNDPYSMFYGETWAGLDKLTDALSALVIDTDGAIFPECAQWVTDWTPDAPAIPYVTPAIQPVAVAYVVTPLTTPSAAVPEPSTWAMLLLGLGSLGLFKKWRRA